MKREIGLFCWATAALLGVGGCRQASGDCVVKGTVQGVRNGTVVELKNEWDGWKIVGKGRVRNGVFEIYPETSGPAHVYLLVHNGTQLKDFFLEPGTIQVDADAVDESTLFLGATGTPANDIYHKIKVMEKSGQEEAANALIDSVLAVNEAGPLALRLADYYCNNASQHLDVLDKLTPELASLPYVAEKRDDLTRRIKTEPRTEGSDFVPVFIDMEFPDVQGNPVKLSDVVNNPADRYVLLDFWATWCGPCLKTLPELRELYAKYHEKGLEIYSVAENDREKKWKPFIEENGMTWINVFDPEGRDSKTRYAYAFDGIPTILLIDGETGEILIRGGNELDLEAILSGLLP